MVPKDTPVIEDNRYSAREFILGKLGPQPTLLCYETWADWLESSDLFPTDLQNAMKEPLKEGIAINMDAEAKRRRKKPIHPNWPQKAERWCISS